MRYTRNTLLLVVTAVLLIASSGLTQTCGDVNNDSTLNIMDMLSIGYFTGAVKTPAGGMGVFVESVADVDGFIGISVADQIAIWDSVMHKLPLDCTPSLNYSYTPSLTDTVFIPRISGITDDYTRIVLPISVSFDTLSSAYYFPFLLDNLTNGTFRLDTIMDGHGWATINYAMTYGDTTMLSAMGEASPDGMVRTGAVYLLIYNRVMPGPGSINIQAVDRADPWRFALVKDHDLVIPTIQYYDYTPPPDTLYVSNSNLFFQAIAGETSPDSFYVRFTTSRLAYTFNLTPSDPWILVNGQAQTSITTPDSVLVTIDTGPLAVGTHSGSIQFTGIDSSLQLSAPDISVTAEILEPFLYPAGDFNCDGAVDVADLTIFIMYLFLNGEKPVHCR